MSEASKSLYLRGTFLDFTGPAADAGDVEKNFRCLDDGLMRLEGGLVKELVPYPEAVGRGFKPGEVDFMDWSGKFVVPGFIDAHVHYPQTEMIASYGEQLLDWLNKYTFPTERKYADKNRARAVSDFFLRELLKNGTTTAVVFCAVFPQSADAFFEAAEALNMRTVAGKVMMDRNAPDYLLDTPESAYHDSLRLIDKWHGRGRALYAVTPRFAPTSTDAQLRVAGKLLEARPGVYMQTHLAENKNEVRWVAELYPRHRNYLHVYESFGLTGPRCLFAHCVHLDDDEWAKMADSRSVACFSPTSNLFLGSGMFDYKRARDEGVRVALATDVGGGTSLSQLASLGEAYKICQLTGHKLSAVEQLYLATMGGASSLSLDGVLGNFEPGKEADLAVLDPGGTDLMAMRSAQAGSVREKLFVLTTMGDDRAVAGAYAAGRLVHVRGENPPNCLRLG